jgi:hypothetical protein
LPKDKRSPFEFSRRPNRKRVEERETIYETVKNLGAGTGGNGDSLPPSENFTAKCGRPEPPKELPGPSAKRTQWRGDLLNGLFMAQADSERTEEKKSLSIELGLGKYEFGLMRKCFSGFEPSFHETSASDIFN